MYTRHLYMNPHPSFVAAAILSRHALRPWLRRMRPARKNRKKMWIVLLRCWSASSKRSKLILHLLKKSRTRLRSFVSLLKFGYVAASDRHSDLGKPRSKRVKSPKKRDKRHRHLSRSKSISAGSVTSSDDRGKRSRGKKRRRC